MKDIHYYTQSDNTAPRKHDYKFYNIVKTDSDGIPSDVVHKKATRNEVKEFFSTVGVDDVKLPIIPTGLHSDSSETSQVKTNDETYMIIGVFDRESYQEDSKEHMRKRQELLNEFYNDLAVEHGYDPDSNLHRVIYDKAFEDGHSSGLSEVTLKYGELSEFVDHVRSL